MSCDGRCVIGSILRSVVCRSSRWRSTRPWDIARRARVGVSRSVRSVQSITCIFGRLSICRLQVFGSLSNVDIQSSVGCRLISFRSPPGECDHRQDPQEDELEPPERPNPQLERLCHALHFRKSQHDCHGGSVVDCRSHRPTGG